MTTTSTFLANAYAPAMASAVFWSISHSFRARSATGTITEAEAASSRLGGGAE